MTRQLRNSALIGALIAPYALSSPCRQRPIRLPPSSMVRDGPPGPPPQPPPIASQWMVVTAATSVTRLRPTPTAATAQRSPPSFKSRKAPR